MLRGFFVVIFNAKGHGEDHKEHGQKSPQLCH
jgi:hypothetical protein